MAKYLLSIDQGTTGTTALVMALDGRTHRAAGQRSFVSVLAPQCMVADALTKVVLARGARSEPVLQKYGAGAYFYSERSGWLGLGLAA